MSEQRTVRVAVGRPFPEMYDVTSPTGVTVRIHVAAICEWSQHHLREKLASTTADLTISEMRTIRDAGFILKGR
jgi:hypothetical protein